LPAALFMVFLLDSKYLHRSDYFRYFLDVNTNCSFQKRRKCFSGSKYEFSFHIARLQNYLLIYINLIFPEPTPLVSAALVSTVFNFRHR